MLRSILPLPTLDLIRQILRGGNPVHKCTVKPTGRYLVSAATLQGLPFAVKDGAERVSARASGELSFEHEGHVWTIVRSTSVENAICVEYEL